MSGLRAQGPRLAGRGARHDGRLTPENIMIIIIGLVILIAAVVAGVDAAGAAGTVQRPSQNARRDGVSAAVSFSLAKHHAGGARE